MDTFPGVEAEVTEAFERYNAALDQGDVERLNAFFWNSPHTVRFGPSENLFAYDEIARFRSGRWSAGAPRRLVRLQVTALGPDAAITSALFQTEGTGNYSRQTQAWRRLDEGWRIAAAHVSTAPSS